MISQYEITIVLSRFGLIAAVKTIKDVKKGEEFLIHYGYPIQESSPRWYNKLFEEHSKKNPGASTDFDYLINNIADNRIDIDDDYEATVKKRRKMKNIMGTTYWY